MLLPRCVFNVRQDRPLFMPSAFEWFYSSFHNECHTMHSRSGRLWSSRRGVCEPSRHTCLSLFHHLPVLPCSPSVSYPHITCSCNLLSPTGTKNPAKIIPRLSSGGRRKPLRQGLRTTASDPSTFCGDIRYGAAGNNGSGCTLCCRIRRWDIIDVTHAYRSASSTLLCSCVIRSGCS